MSDEQRHRSFKTFFHAAVGQDPFPFQWRYADGLQGLVHVPTGLGKTAMAVVGWLWRRFGAVDDVRRQTPRRLVYCLPMRVLVEQTRDNAVCWLENLRQANLVECDVPVHVLMGGEDECDWDIHPEREAIIIGTQDMLLSRALNRGYAASRSRWPMQFGLLHTDCLWVFDEIQLMGSGLATTAQLEAFRRMLPNKDTDDAKNGHACRSVWMSATMRPEWLSTVDFKSQIDALPRLKLEEADHKNDEISKRWNATKKLMPPTPKSAAMGDAVALADEICKAHKQGTRTIVVVNTVKRACELFEKIVAHSSGVTSAHGKKAKADKKSLAVPETASAPLVPLPKVVLLHSRFRPDDRKIAVDAALAPPTAEGTIVVSTQVIEAGVDVSATTLFTELAPWASLVQRFGRCNRRGEENEHASVRWIDLPANETDAEKVRFPYELSDLRAAAEQLKALKDVGLGSLAAHRSALSDDEANKLFAFKHTHVIRRKDLLDLFDTTPDLAGNDIDIDRYVREIEETDVRVFWRSWSQPKGHEPPPDEEPAPRREELCPAPVGEFRDFTKKHGDKVWRWNFLGKVWERASVEGIAPGQVYLVHADAGGYTAAQGWDPKSANGAQPVAQGGECAEPPDGTDDERLARIGLWQTIAQHTDEVCNELDNIIKALPVGNSEIDALRQAARWHDWGKVHDVFRRALPDGVPDATKAWGKAAGNWKRYERRHFRHELASALAVLHPEVSLANVDRNLVAYLIAAHHGKVRLSIRSLPNEMRPRDGDGKRIDGCRFARGVWDGDVLPATDLGGDVTAPAVTLSLEPMEMGLCEQLPFAGQPSWAERMIRLRDTLGPFRLAYLEAILRAADMRASAAASDHPGTINRTQEEAAHA